MFKNKKQNKKEFVFFTKSESGVSLIFTVLFLTMVLSTGLGIANLMLKEIKISSNIGYSVPAYYAAEAGIEKILYMDRKGGGVSEGDKYNSNPDPITDPPLVTICNSSDFNICGFEAEVTGIGPIVIKSVGTYSGVKRGVEVSY
jgi:hypothetical protein